MRLPPNDMDVRKKNLARGRGLVHILGRKQPTYAAGRVERRVRAVS